MTDFNLPDMTEAPNIVSVFQDHISDLKSRYEKWVANFASLPESGDYYGQKVGVTSESKMYVWNGTSWAQEQITWTQVTGKPSTFTPSAHTHNASDINTGTLPIARGGTGGTTAAAVRENLEVCKTTSGTGNPLETEGEDGDVYFKVVT